MDANSGTILSWTVFLPLLAAIPLCFFPKSRAGLIRGWTLLVLAAGFLLSVWAVSLMRAGEAGPQLVHRRPWIPSLGVEYFLGIDGISVYLVLLTTMLTPLVVLSAFRAVSERVKEFHILLLVLQTGMLGVFLALDVFLFYIFWELVLIPMYLLIGVWGGPRRIYAAVKFVLYTIVGSLLMLVAILALYFLHERQTGVATFNLLRLYETALSTPQQLWLFAAFALAFAIKVPVFPLHTWLPDAHVEAPTAGSVVLAGILLKLGTYGFLRFALPLFPEAARAAQPLLLTLAVIGIIYGALVAMVQTDVKKLVAYSSVSHLGFCMLGLFSFNLTGFSGSLMQMVNHGLSTGALFLLVGIIYERRHTREIQEFGGLARTLPWFATVFVLVTLSSIGLPGLNGFIGEFLVLLGAFEANPAAAVLSTLGVILGAVYMLWLVKRFLFGPVTREENRRLPDLSLREFVTLAPILLFIVYLGVHPRPFLARMEPSLRAAVALSTGGPERARTIGELQAVLGPAAPRTEDRADGGEAPGAGPGPAVPDGTERPSRDPAAGAAPGARAEEVAR